MKYYAITDNEVTAKDAYGLFRVDKEGGLLLERYAPGGKWVNDPTLLDFFTTEDGAVLVDEDAAKAIAGRLDAHGYV